MKKFTKIFAFAMALMMVFALQAPVSAAEKGAVIEAGVEAPEATVMTDVTKDYFALSSYPSNNTASFKVVVPQDVSGVQLRLYNYKGKQIAYKNVESYYYASSYRYVDFNIKKNQAYYVRAVSYITVNGQTTYGTLSSPRAFVNLNRKAFKSKTKYLNNNTKRFIIKIPKKAKFKGIKSFTLYMSKKRDTGYRKYKKVKPGTTVTISSFKKKKFRTAKDFYYIKIVPNLTKKISSDTYVYVYQ